MFYPSPALMEGEMEGAGQPHAPRADHWANNPEGEESRHVEVKEQRGEGKVLLQGIT